MIALERKTQLLAAHPSAAQPALLVAIGQGPGRCRATEGAGLPGGSDWESEEVKEPGPAGKPGAFSFPQDSVAHEA